MPHQKLASGFPATRFGRRKLVPRVLIIDGKPHIRRFLAETLEELGFVTDQCAAAAELGLMLRDAAPDLAVIALSAADDDAAAILDALSAHVFDGKVLLLGPADSLIVAAAQERGDRLGLAMLPTLVTPFDSGALRRCVATLLPAEAPPHPIIDAGEALSEGWLDLWYQPIFSTRTLQMCGAEALLRVRHPSWGVVPPAYFLPGKDDPSLRSLSEFVIDRAIRDCGHHFAPHHEIEIALNLPVSFLENALSIVNLCRQVANHQVLGGLIVEIDAADIIRHLSLVKAAAKQLRFGKIAIAVDDLGTEWPSFAGLEDLPFAEIKVDRAFIIGVADDRRKQSICRQIVDLADRHGTRTVAEGVESRADFFMVREIGFDLAQGFLLAKPMTPQRFAATASQQAALPH
jgi:EAL domain-containing protein (putative c-di-GMP-specific phosphodiesterase class I)/CheY-like chemotaxis protein